MFIFESNSTEKENQFIVFVIKKTKPIAVSKIEICYFFCITNFFWSDVKTIPYQNCQLNTINVCFS